MNTRKMLSEFVRYSIAIIFIAIQIYVVYMLPRILAASFSFSDIQLGINFCDFFILWIPFFGIVYAFALAWRNQLASIYRILERKNIILEVKENNINHKKKISYDYSIASSLRRISNKSKKIHVKFLLIFFLFIGAVIVVLFQMYTCATAFIYYSIIGDFDESFFTSSNSVLIVSLLIDYFMVTFFILKGILFKVDRILTYVLAFRIMKKTDSAAS